MKRFLSLLILTSYLLAACSNILTPDLESTEQTAVAATLATQPTEAPTPALTATFTSTAIPTETMAPTPTATASPTPIPTFTLSGVVFFDYNGNGVRDDGEPPIPGATVQIGALATNTGPDGSYTLEGVPRGNQQVGLSAPGFRYVSLSLDAFQSSGRPVRLMIDGNKQRDWGLVQGFVTFPFPVGVSRDVDPASGGDWYDHDPSLDSLYWNGQRWQGPRDHSPPNTHPGIDYLMPIGTPILAPAPGVVHSVYVVEGEINYIGMNFPNGMGASFIHISQALVGVGDQVSRCQPIALSGSSGTSVPHTEFQLYRWFGRDAYLIDPYRPLVDLPNGVWVAGTWEWKILPSEEEWVLAGYWTKENDPQYCP